MRHLALLAVALSFSVQVPTAVGQQPIPLTIEEGKLIASDAASEDEFGWAVALSGNTAVIGGQLAWNQTGAAYVLTRDGSDWTESVELLGSAPAANARFGYSVAISGDTIAIGAPSHNSPSQGDGGAVYVFSLVAGAWEEQARLTASPTEIGDEFGHAVALDGDTLVVGAPSVDASGQSNIGAAYVFVRDGVTWSQQASLIGTDSNVGDRVGYSVAVNGETAIVGAWAAQSGSGENGGAAYVFVRDGTSWGQQGKLAPNVTLYAKVGCAVSIVADTALIGAWGYEGSAATYPGAAYVFVRSGATWSQQSLIRPADVASPDQFGTSVALLGSTGDKAVIGSPGDEDAGFRSGSSYVFTRAGAQWTEERKITASDAAAGDYFGQSVAYSGDTALIGAFNDNHSALGDAGSAYSFRVLEYSWQDLGHALGGTHGEPVLVPSGTMFSGDDVAFDLSNARQWALAYFVVSISNLSYFPFYGGTLVPDPVAPNGFYIILNTLSGGSVTLNSAWPTGVPSGSELYFQYWIADPVGPFGYSASNAVKGTTP